MSGWREYLLYLGGAKGGAIVRLYQNGGYDESMPLRQLSEFRKMHLHARTDPALLGQDQPAISGSYGSVYRNSSDQV